MHRHADAFRMPATRSAYRDIPPAGGDTAMPVNLAKRLRVVQRYACIRGKRVLDCGCGAGEYVRGLLGAGADAWGIEFSRAKLLDSRPGVAGRVWTGDLHCIGLRDGVVDIALLNEVLEHVSDDRRVLLEVYRVLRPGGTLIVFSPNRRYPFETHGAMLKGSGRRVPPYVPLVPYLPLPIASALLEFWARNYWPGELQRLVADAGFTIAHTDYVWQTFENISGRQPLFIARAARLLRALSASLERVPLIRSLGASQVVVAVK